MKVIESHYAFQGRLLKLRVDTVEVSPEQRFNMEIIEHTGAVAMLPIDDDGMIHLVRQYRHATGGELLEVPAGTLSTLLAGTARSLFRPTPHRCEPL